MANELIATDPIVAETLEVREIAGSDHRAVLTRLRIPDDVLTPGSGSPSPPQ